MDTTLKAIDTVYRGHKFRSRLEARWAVFYTEMGIDFQYEVEGYELPCGWYLPDFYLPKYNGHFEAKPPPFVFTGWPKVYMAGRMKRESCYRPFNIETGFRNGAIVAPVRPKRLLKALIRYVGPYRDDGQHGEFRPRQHDADVSDRPGTIFERSINGIEACDVFFALIEDLEAYGTIGEIFYAFAKQKRIILGFTQAKRWDREPTKDHEDWIEPDKDDHRGNLWFIMKAAEKCLDGTREEILKQFADWLCKEYPLPREQQLAFELAERTRGTMTVVYGDPYEVFVEENGVGGISEVKAWQVSDPNYSFLFTIDYERRKRAATIARQARFEHGEQG